MDSLPKNLNPHKHLKERFVSNLNGSSMLETAALLTIVPIQVLLLRSIFPFCSVGISSKKSDDHQKASSKSWSVFMGSISLDFFVIFLPVLLFFTVLADWTYMGAISSVLLLLFYVAAKSPRFDSAYCKGQPHSLRQIVSLYRVAMMVITCFCILAVDFTVFPRRYAKTERYGTSLMDLGVGSFVLANSIVSRQARCVGNRVSGFQSTSPLLVLGLIRLVTTTGVNYQVHVGEYGVHWNFFFTLAAIAILTSIVDIHPRYSGIFGFLIVAGYQISLNWGLNTYLLSDEREKDIISQNKEGIYSIIGYWGMYLVGVSLGYCLFYGDRSAIKTSKGALGKVSLLSLIFWLLTIFLDTYVERVSRRTCNLPYVTWILAQNLQVLATFMLSADVLNSRISTLEEALNQNLLASFLLANVLTGLVNLSTDTISTSSISALLILLAYAYTLSILVGVFHFLGIRLKFW